MSARSRVRRRVACSRFRRWREAGVWDQVLTALQHDAAHDGALDGSLAMIDGSSIRAHQQAAGAPKKGATTTSAAAMGDGAASSAW